MQYIKLFSFPPGVQIYSWFLDKLKKNSFSPQEFSPKIRGIFYEYLENSIPQFYAKYQKSGVSGVFLLTTAN